MSTLLYNLGILVVVSSGILLIVRGSMKKSLLLTSLGINLALLPLALFIGIMATDSPNSVPLDFVKGFLFIEGIPIVLFLVSVIRAIIKSNRRTIS